MTAPTHGSRLVAEHLTLSYGDEAVVADLDLLVPDGRITALVGPNACGKSTLLRGLARLLRPRTGTVLLDGREIHRASTREVAMQLGLLPQAPTVPEGLTVEDLVGRGRYPHQSWRHQWSAADERAVERALELTGTTDLRARQVDALSGGQRQRAWIAMALAQETPLLLLDEPTTWLDLAHQIEVLDLLERLNEQEGRTIVLVIHDLNLAARYAHQLVAMREGRICVMGPPAEVVTESIVREVFGLPCRVIVDPVSGTPLVLPMGRHERHSQPRAHVQEPATGEGYRPTLTRRDSHLYLSESLRYPCPLFTTTHDLGGTVHMTNASTSPRGRDRIGRLALSGLLATAMAAMAVPAMAQSDAPAGAYPVTIAHKYGETVVEQAPERVVTVGLTDQDAFIALGHPPVGVNEWYGEQPYGAWPWAAPLLGDATPTVLNDPDGFDFEAIKALQPDLIVGLYSGMTQEEFDTLSAIAPTVAQPGDTPDWGISWQQQTLTTGEILGKTAEAGALIGQVEGLFGRVQAEHPEFAGKTAIVATPYEGIWVYGPSDVRGRLLTRLGFTLPEGLEAVTGQDYGGNLSEENVDMLDVDAIIWLDALGVADLGGPLYASLPVHTEGREVYLDSFDDPLGAATSFVTVLSLPFLLEGLVPRLALAVDGDPATVVPVTSPAPEASPAS